MRRRLAAIVKRAWSDGAECLIGTFLFYLMAIGLCGLLIGAVLGGVLGAAGVRLGDDVRPGGLGQVLLGLLCGAILGGFGGMLLGALLGGVFGAFSGFLIGSVEVGSSVKDAVITSLRARRTTGVATEVAPARAPAGRGDEAASAHSPTMDIGGNP